MAETKKRRCEREEAQPIETGRLDGSVEAFGAGDKKIKRQDSGRDAGVDEADVHRSIRRVRPGLRAVVRVATNPGGDAGDKTPFGPVDLSTLFASQRVLSGD